MGDPQMQHNCRLMRTRVALALVAVLIVPSSALDNGLARTPPMGFNTWNAFGCNITEALVKKQMDLMVDLGLVDMGYRFFNLDDCWSSLSRDSHGRLQADPDRFPSGIPHLVEYARKHGMVLGLYGDAGVLTCAGRPGSQNHEEEDAALLASWGVGYFKYDNCWADILHPIPRYVKMRDQLLKHSEAQPVVFSICEWGTAQPHLWAPKVGHLWRTSQDIRASTSSWRANLDATVGLSMYAGPGAWNDPDMLEVGHPKALRPQEEAAHFALWALLKAPLLVGCDLSRLQPLARELLRSRLLVAANQDALGVAGDLVWKQGMTEIFAAPLRGGRRAVVLHNRNLLLPNVDVTLPWSLVGYADACALRITDMFSEFPLGQFSGHYRTHVQPGAAVALLLEPVRGRCSPSQGADDSWRPWHSGFFGSKQEGPPVPPPPSGTADLVQDDVLPQEQAV